MSPVTTDLYWLATQTDESKSLADSRNNLSGTSVGHIMKIETYEVITPVHGRVLRTLISGGTEVKINDKLGELIKNKDVVGLSFMGTYATFDVKKPKLHWADIFIIGLCITFLVLLVWVFI